VAHVYDLRNRKPLGYGREFKTEILPNRASFFAISPKPVPPVRVQVAANGQRGKVLKVQLTVNDTGGSHAVLVSAKFPVRNSAFSSSGDFFPREGYPGVNGSQNHEERDLLRQVIIVGSEPATVDLPIAFNDPTGIYEISATELFTNHTVTKKFSVK